MPNRPEGKSIHIVSDEVRVYGRPNCCRLASFILALTESQASGTTIGSTVARDAVIDIWRQTYPQHMEFSGKSSVHGRIRMSLPRLKNAGIAQSIPDRDLIEVINPEYLAMAAANLGIVEDEMGLGISPVLWSAPIQVPEHLMGAQALLAQNTQGSSPIIY